jgi:alpha-galactosidase
LRAPASGDEERRNADGSAQAFENYGLLECHRPSHEVKRKQNLQGVEHAAIGGLASGIVFNRGVVENLPADAAVVADAAGIHPISLGPLPDAVAKLLSTQINVQQLAAEAAVHASKEIPLQSLLIDPVINSATAAVKLLDGLWEVNRLCIRPCV